MKYGKNYILKYIQKKDDKIIFDIIDEEGFNRIVDGTMEDLRKILYFSKDLTIEDDFKTIQDSLISNPVVFLARRKPLENMSELNFAL